MTSKMTICWIMAVCAACAAFGQDTAPVTIANPNLSISFSAETGGFTAITFVKDGHGFIRKAAERPLSWRLVLRDAAGKETVVDNTSAARPGVENKPGEVALHWRDVGVGEEKAVLDVRMVCRLSEGVDEAALLLHVTNASKTVGLWDVQFPVIAPVSEAGAADVYMGRGNWGERYEKASDKIAGEYPSNNLPMQFTLLHEQDFGLYLAAYDASAMYKRFEIQPGAEFVAHTRPPNMGVPGSGWASPYSFVLSAYRGDWMSGCKRYRAWALKEAPWTRKGPLSKRSDVPENIKGVCAWLNASGPPEEVVPAVKQFAESVGAPVGVHWYCWHQVPFDTHYPDYFPTKPGFAEGVAELKKAGVVVMPYINARLWDSGNEDFADAKRAATTDEKGDVTIEEYGSGAKLAVMCPSQKLWQDKILSIIQRLADECGVNAVYMDQIASAAPRMCFNRDHGHPLGSGDWWVGGYRTMLTPIKNWCTSGGRQVGLTTENDAEPYMDNVDGLLIWVPRDDHEVPMTTAVYGGYTLYFASNHAFDFGDPSYCLCQARDFVWGSQLGWDNVGILEPAHAAKLEFLSRLAKLRAKAKDLLVYGELVECVPPQDDIPDIEGTWNTMKGDAPVKLKAVQAALWRAPDGTLGLIAANADTAAHTVSAAPVVSRQGKAPAMLVTPDGQQTLDAIPAAIEVPARSVVLLSVKAPQ